MANPSTDTSRRRTLRLRLKIDVAYMLTAAIMAVMGTLFSTAAFAAGVNNVDVLAMLVMGASGALLTLLLWYLVQLRGR